MTILTAIENYLINSHATKSIKTYLWEEKTFRSFKFFCNKHNVQEMEHLDKHVLLDYIGFEKERHLMNSTLNKKIKLIKRLFVYNSIKSDITNVKTLREKKHTVDRLSDDELKILFQYLNNLDLEIGNNYIYKTLYYFLFDTGVRIDESLHIKKENINFEKKIILLDITKFSKERIIDFSTRLEPMLKKCFELSKGIYLFWNIMKNRKLDYDSDVQYFYHKIKKETKCAKLTAHRLRHTFASISAQNGMNILSLKEILGHDNLRTTQKYLHANRKKTKSDFESYSPLNNNDIDL